MVSSITIDQAAVTDREAIVQLLEQVDLPAAHVDEHLSNFLVARDGQQIVGCAGMEIYGDTCLLRSLAVHPEYQGRGLGRQLAQEIINRARRQGLKEAVILTKTIEPLAVQFGFEKIPREAVDRRVTESWEFQVNCCQTATCLRLKL
jgi:amino-acid N-acetyltransferase